MAHHLHLHSHSEEPKPSEKPIEFVLSEKRLQEFFGNDISHIEKRKYQFSTAQRALSYGQIVFSKEIISELLKEEVKQDVFAWAKMAAVNGVKQTPYVVPFVCAGNIEQIKARVLVDESNCALTLYCYVAAFTNRSVETETLNGVSAGLIALYDQYKHRDPGIQLGGIQLLFKEDGHEGLWFNPQGIPDSIRSIFVPPFKFLKDINTVIVSISDKAVEGIHPDAGDLLKRRLEEQGANIIDYKLMGSNEHHITDYVKKIVNEKNPHLVMLRGTAGISPYDKTPIAHAAIIERKIPGFGELLRIYGSRYTSGAWNACCEAGILNKTLVISIPGARKVIDEVMQILPITLADAIGHLQEITLESDHTDEIDIPSRLWT